MMKTKVRWFLCLIAFVFAVQLAFGSLFEAGAASKKPHFKIAWSIYVGWMPWDYADHSGILKKWADKYGIEIELIPRMNYIDSINAYAAGQADGVVATNMETLDMPAASGIDSTAVIMGDFSNGNDAVQTRGITNVAGLKNNEVSLVELSVSHYLLARCLEKNGLKENDVKIVNTSDSNIAPAFIANTEQRAVVTWNPMVMQIAQVPGVKTVCTSGEIPGEIQDLLVVQTNTLKKNPELGKALVGTWYEVMRLMSGRGPDTEAALAYMAQSSEATLQEYKSQLRTTAMFYTPQSAIEFTKSADMKSKMDFVRKFCFAHKLLGENAASVDVVGVQYPDGSVQGNPKNVKMRYDTTFMQMAADGTL